MLRAKRGASISGDCSIRWRRVRAGRVRRGKSPASSAAIRTYCSGRVGDQFGQAQVHELAEAGAADDRWPHEGDHGHAHPEGVQAGGVAVVGEGVQPQVDAGGKAPDTAGGAGGRRTFTRSGAMPSCASKSSVRWRWLPFGGQISNLRTLDGLEDSGPEFQHGGVDLAEVVEAAEGDVALRQGGQGVDGRFAAERIVAPESVGQADRLLGVDGRR